MALALASTGITNANLAAGAGIAQVVTATSGGYTVANGGSWQTLGNSVTITPLKAGNRIILSCAFVYPKETSNFMNTNNYRFRYGSNYATQPDESFCYSDPWTHQNMTGLGFHQYIFTVGAGEVGVAQTCALEWTGGSGQFVVGSYVTTAVRLTAWECA